MNYRRFKDVSVAEIGLGTWQLGSADWGNIKEEEALHILQAYTDAGGNFIDTADVYGMGISETIIGKFLQSVKKELFVATKLGRRGDGINGWPQNFTYDAMKASCGGFTTASGAFPIIFGATALHSNRHHAGRKGIRPFTSITTGRTDQVFWRQCGNI
jgi:diketogulonate reductase-like aldo/keto reductase